jgi:hypothetical protein
MKKLKIGKNAERAPIGGAGRKKDTNWMLIPDAARDGAGRHAGDAGKW